MNEMKEIDMTRRFVPYYSVLYIADGLLFNVFPIIR
jgi:hypothetical protein